MRARLTVDRRCFAEYRITRGHSPRAANYTRIHAIILPIGFDDASTLGWPIVPRATFCNHYSRFSVGFCTIVTTTLRFYHEAPFHSRSLLKEHIKCWPIDFTINMCVYIFFYLYYEKRYVRNTIFEYPSFDFEVKKITNTHDKDLYGLSVEYTPRIFTSKLALLTFAHIFFINWKDTLRIIRCRKARIFSIIIRHIWNDLIINSPIEISLIEQIPM